MEQNTKCKQHVVLLITNVMEHANKYIKKNTLHIHTYITYIHTYIHTYMHFIAKFTDYSNNTSKQDEHGALATRLPTQRQYVLPPERIPIHMSEPWRQQHKVFYSICVSIHVDMHCTCLFCRSALQTLGASHGTQHSLAFRLTYVGDAVSAVNCAVQFAAVTASILLCSYAIWRRRSGAASLSWTKWIRVNQNGRRHGRESK
jgi:hypothetical protein